MPLRSAFLALALACAAAACGDGYSPDTGADAGSTPPDTSTTKLSGTLGDLGAAQPTVSSFMISNSGETLIYMTSAPISCDTLKTSRWLGSVQAGAQVVEIVISGDPKVGTYKVPPGEVNYAKGGRSSAYEVNANGGKIVFTKAEVKSVVEGTVEATYDKGSISGTFHATFCDQGQGY